MSDWAFQWKMKFYPYLNKQAQEVNFLKRINKDSSFSRPSQIACTVTTVHVTCMQTALHVNESLCTVLKGLDKTS